ncbi:MerR family transcriptional regulator [Nannocystis sp. ILAH1]|uniref:MerR family transcriptional regulator n=1 Tax=unclassified Nannocystis TaxID=2627009 RepID=UPI00226E6BC7|nr:MULTISPECIES: MerR family transcriptional regulator [unclassified Nannocystis]MCY0987919.1 MerR family transcriptional regulator [Nannocystis sp. ILAH1]MCY1070276.1 MerR family transcriptional regulator [Nannocystis sp. RBIL2]
MSISEAKSTLAPTAGVTRPGRIKIGELARKTGKTPRALHLYEEMGLLVPSARTEGGFRLYGPDEVARVYWITKLQDIGFSLPQIQSLLGTVAASQTAPEAMNSVRELFRGKLDDTRAQVTRLLQLERDLSESLAYLEGCRLCQEPAKPDACTNCISERRSDEPTPSLVVGIHRKPGAEPVARPCAIETAASGGRLADLSSRTSDLSPRTSAPDLSARTSGPELAARPGEFAARPAERSAAPTEPEGTFP